MAYNNRGIAYYVLGQYKRAIEDFDVAIQLNRGYANAYDWRGSAYFKLGQYANADADEAKACSLDSKYCD